MTVVPASRTGDSTALGRQHAGAAHLHHDVLDHGELLLRRVLEGHRPLGELGGGAQPLPVRQVVALDDRPVDVEGVVHPLLVDPVDLRLNLRRVGEGLVGDHLEVLGGHVVQGLRVVLEGLALRQLEVEHLDIQLPLRADLGVQLPQGPGGGVPGIGHEGLALQLPAGIDLREHRPGHIDLAPDDEPGQLLRQLHGDGADGLEVLRHVLPTQPGPSRALGWPGQTNTPSRYSRATDRPSTLGSTE